MKLTIIPSDNTIIMDGRVLVFPFTAPIGLHAIQWYDNNTGDVATDGGRNSRSAVLADITPYVELFNAESARLAAIAATPLTLDQTKTKQIAALEAAYTAAIQLPVAYMATTFQADSDSQDILAKSLVPGKVPVGFYWIDSANAKVTMTFVQAQDLAYAMLVQGMTNFDKLQTKKTAVRAALTVADVQLVVW